MDSQVKRESDGIVRRMFEQWLGERQAQVSTFAAAHAAKDGGKPPSAEEVAVELGTSLPCAAYYLDLVAR
jgi:hypothetical protein